MEPEERAVREAHAAWIEAMNAGDPPGLLSMLLRDARTLSPVAR